MIKWIKTKWWLLRHGEARIAELQGLLFNQKRLTRKARSLASLYKHEAEWSRAQVVSEREWHCQLDKLIRDIKDAKVSLDTGVEETYVSEDRIQMYIGGPPELSANYDPPVPYSYGVRTVTVQSIEAKLRIGFISQPATNRREALSLLAAKISLITKMLDDIGFDGLQMKEVK